MKSKNAEIDAEGAGQHETFEGPSGSARGANDVPMEEDFSYDIDDDAGAAADEIAAGGIEDTARYIAEMVASLAAMAREARLDLLNYLLDMAHVEAELQARRSEAPDEEA